MSPKRRAVVLLGAGAVGFGALGYRELTDCEEFACFAFEYQGADDAPNRLTIEHTGGTERLRAGDVFVTNVSTDYEAGESDTLAWAELDDDLGPDDAIDGEGVRISIRFPDVVTVRWRRDGDEEVVGAWVYDDDER
ncbi:hypothetical protein C465_06973 [Halorubrum distributum JCM 9100]|uniref:Uncharacterized protein n=4 Tax=Halorubrum distributum TaxID=29283 RepID=M0ETC3_9EURY|nr:MULTISPECIES: hypothetical protein [Halorubrum distributum group]ELZ32369.1 hypothetical protein C473_08647 [Halorubrum terrestre JCM 10247]ELZ49674.1 hypothetical protein C465_06973 [Halorubrum distributum JCM 9100]ELZ56982.1 hypothetical protein C466_02754 [Halorubrum distributum JCM 10118]MYL68525.1 hypothetical protein [Halorubrum terrestre]